MEIVKENFFPLYLNLMLIHFKDFFWITQKRRGMKRPEIKNRNKISLKLVKKIHFIQMILS
jgi:hypothetical protein